MGAARLSLIAGLAAMLTAGLVAIPTAGLAAMLIAGPNVILTADSIAGLRHRSVRRHRC
ncbi:MAG TPA: hypothetical protein VGX23_28625 [Actinocrinis sp.]|nr:hypothetical protein [Actinocrinis sp.]